MSKNTKTLDEKYKEIVFEYINEFSKKQEIEFDYWVGDRIGGIACFGDFFFQFEDIMLDVSNNKIEKGEIIKWYDYMLDRNDFKINYWTWTKGLRPEIFNK